MKSTFAATLVVTALFSGIVNASHELGSKSETVVVRDGHISWHEFRHELSAYGQITASMSSGGIVTLQGKTDDGADKKLIENIARKIRGATEIHNYITTE